MMAPEETILWRVGTLEKRLAEEQKSRQDDIRSLDIEKADARDMNRLSDEVASLRRALIVFSLSMVGSGGAFLIGVLALVNHP